MAILYLASVLQKHGIGVKVIDMQVDSSPVNEIVRKILDEQPRLIGFTGHTNEYPSAKETAKSIRSVSEVKIIIGGPHSFLYWDYILLEEDMR